MSLAAQTRSSHHTLTHPRPYSSVQREKVHRRLVQHGRKVVLFTNKVNLFLVFQNCVIGNIFKLIFFFFFLGDRSSLNTLVSFLRHFLKCYLFMAALGLHCFARAFSSYSKQGPLLQCAGSSLQ